MEKKIEQITSFKIVGIAVETTNANEQSAQDMGKIWGRFFQEGISNQIPNKISEEIYAIYTDYETDYQGKHTAIIGHKVSSLDNIPEGMIWRVIQGGKYQKFIAKGAMPNAVSQTWKKIWEKDKILNRRYSSDFEVYSAKSQNGENAKIDIYIGVQ